MPFTGLAPAGRLGMQVEYDIFDRGAHLAGADLDRNLSDARAQPGKGDGLHVLGDPLPREVARSMPPSMKP